MRVVKLVMPLAFKTRKKVPFRTFFASFRGIAGSQTRRGKENGVGAKSPGTKEQLLHLFILPLNWGTRIENANAADGQKQELVLEMDQLMKTFQMKPWDAFPLEKPTYVKETPFEYHSKWNGDPSYVSNPRLSVTKLLTDQWCELQEMYRVYAGSPERRKSKQMQMGSKVHLQLELDDYGEMEVVELEDYLDQKLIQLHARNQKDARASQTDENVPRNSSEGPSVQNTIEEPRLSDGRIVDTEEASLAYEWLTKITKRLYILLTRSEAREVLVHGYLDLDSGEIVKDGSPSSLSDKSNVLVSGVVDLLSLETEGTDRQKWEIFKEIQDLLEITFPKTTDTDFLVDLSEFIRIIGPVLQSDARQYMLTLTDIKTRTFNSIPAQESVVEATKKQISFYRNFLGVLSGNVTNESVYEMLLENARRRHLDLDAPISFKTMFILLATNFDLLYNDFAKLALGTPFGFNKYDCFNNHTNQHGLVEQSTFEYDPSLLVSKDEVHMLVQVANLKFPGINCNHLITNLLRPWRIPLTLRYFAARASQMYNLLCPFLSDRLRIEYRNAKTGHCFKKIDFVYNESELSEASRKALTFWNGKRPPTPVTEISKCTNCEFESRCLIPHPQQNLPNDFGTVGSQLTNFLAS